uniref:Uncharacterized protein n=1 Tax=Chromera velia CCMP2878 TaxID=1169474 RepID=A0A0G4GDA7_9ALVE|eukprot:Cvel_611.t1-p1 / transcript=Cvel_611.t1 / gene=Cvel_611 / organism=Chromera_velia_CCMP2878 / gene_product=hypothetical protein / transcript_product=hypothetical protein / location=Cvel_scaffold19:13395-15350(-) / protein_length=527 / sequence_SO=supercontig / SO=protein_coding / is_pseudo=false
MKLQVGFILQPANVAAFVALVVIQGKIVNNSIGQTPTATDTKYSNLLAMNLRIGFIWLSILFGNFLLVLFQCQPNAYIIPFVKKAVSYRFAAALLLGLGSNVLMALDFVFAAASLAICELFMLFRLLTNLRNFRQTVGSKRHLEKAGIIVKKRDMTIVGFLMVVIPVSYHIGWQFFEVLQKLYMAFSALTGTGPRTEGARFVFAFVLLCLCSVPSCAYTFFFRYPSPVTPAVLGWASGSVSTTLGSAPGRLLLIQKGWQLQALAQCAWWVRLVCLSLSGLGTLRAAIEWRHPDFFFWLYTMWRTGEWGESANKGAKKKKGRVKVPRSQKRKTVLFSTQTIARASSTSSNVARLAKARRSTLLTRKPSKRKSVLPRKSILPSRQKESPSLLPSDPSFSSPMLLPLPGRESQEWEDTGEIFEDSDSESQSGDGSPTTETAEREDDENEGRTPAASSSLRRLEEGTLTSVPAVSSNPPETGSGDRQANPYSRAMTPSDLSTVDNSPMRPLLSGTFRGGNGGRSPATSPLG